MRKINLNITINASREQVWKAITGAEYYNHWTKVFTSTSFFKGGWNTGDTIRFLAYNKEGNVDGMVSEIAESNYPSFISIKHLGYIYHGVDDTTSDEIKSWAPAYENYTLTSLSDEETIFSLDMDVTDDYYDMFMDLWPKAMSALKTTAENIKPQSIYPCLWFHTEAHEAADFYIKVFHQSRLLERNGFVSTFELSGSKFMAMNGGPTYSVNPAVSYYVYCGHVAEIERMYNLLSESGHQIMPLGKYAWSEKYAWVMDKYGVNWQLDIDYINHSQKIVPTLLFANHKKNDVKSAIQYYTSIFAPSTILVEAPFAPEADMPAESLLFAQFKINGVVFNAMSNIMPSEDDFTPGNSFVVECNNQDEIDHFWEQLGHEGRYDRCGWLADKFGVSWQVIPDYLSKLVADPEKGPIAIQAFMKMQKFELDLLPRLG